jgi:hypothetical protein
MADNNGFIPVHRRSNRIKPPKKIPVVPAVPTNLIAPSTTDPNRFSENVRAELILSAPDRSIPREHRTAFNPITAMYNICNTLFAHTPLLILKSCKTVNKTMSSITRFPHDETSFKDFFHVDPNLRPNGDGTVFIYFSIESSMTEGIANITNDPMIKDYLKSVRTYIKSYDFDTFMTLTIGSLFKKSFTHSNLSILLVNLTTALYQALSIQQCDENLPDTTDDLMSETNHSEQLVPYFELATRRIAHTIYTQPDDARLVLDTKAIQVKCSSRNADELAALIVLADLKQSDFGIFVPSAWANTKREQYGDFIVAHNEYLDNLVKITVTGLHRDIFSELINYPTEVDEPYSVYDVLLFEHFPSRTLEDGSTFPHTQFISSIEETSLSDSDGTWLFLTEKNIRLDTVLFLSSVLLDKCTASPARESHLQDSDTYAQGIIINTPLRQQTNDPFQEYGHALNFPLARNRQHGAHTSHSSQSANRRDNSARITYDNEVAPPVFHSDLTAQPTSLATASSAAFPSAHHANPRVSNIPFTDYTDSKPSANPFSQPSNDTRLLPKTPWSVRSPESSLTSTTQPSSDALSRYESTMNSIAQDQFNLRTQITTEPEHRDPTTTTASGSKRHHSNSPHSDFSKHGQRELH